MVKPLFGRVLAHIFDANSFAYRRGALRARRDSTSMAVELGVGRSRRVRHLALGRPHRARAFTVGGAEALKCAVGSAVQRQVAAGTP